MICQEIEKLLNALLMLCALCPFMQNSYQILQNDTLVTQPIGADILLASAFHYQQLIMVNKDKSLLCALYLVTFF